VSPQPPLSWEPSGERDEYNHRERRVTGWDKRKEEGKKKRKKRKGKRKDKGKDKTEIKKINEIRLASNKRKDVS
jgi:hypothetical protein